MAKDCRVKLKESMEGGKPNGNGKSFKPKWKGAEHKSSENVSDSQKCVTGTVNGVTLKMALDSSATCCIISVNVAKAHEFKILESDRHRTQWCH